MRRVSLCGIVAALLPVAALAQALDQGFEPESGFDFTNGSFGTSRGSGVMWLPFAAPGCYNSGTVVGTRGEALTFTRATTATYTDCAGVTQSCASGQFRVGCEGGQVKGLLVERASTNYVLNSGTHPKTAEATGSITAQACVGWHEGTGTMTIAAGTATVTGLSCTAVSPGTLCPFTVTVAGTMAITTSAGTVTKAQIECPGSTKTSYQPTAGTAVARNADVATVAAPSGLSPSRWCVEATATFSSFASDRWLFSNYAGTSVDLTECRALIGGTFNCRIGDSAGALRTAAWSHGLTAPASARVSFSNNGGVVTGRQDGAPKASASTGGTGVQATVRTPLYLGSQLGSSQLDGYLRDLRITRSPLCR